ncbi:MAG TPA: hypothetical protein IAC41_01170 [Candidatus Merdenecus merdavium]|nr:hypothetical protein [Candidatus Merdenecus merdavium]
MKKDIMKGIFLRVIVLVPLFFITIAITGMYINNFDVITTQEMKEATFPVVYTKVGEERINPLYGYAQEMEVNTMRDVVNPLGLDRKLPVEIVTYGQEVKGLTYQIITSDGNDVVEERKIILLKEEDGSINVTLDIQNNMRVNQEYILRIILELPESSVSYYSRIFQQDKLNTDKYVEFLNTFYTLSLTKDSKEELEVYIDPDLAAENTDLSTVSIESSADQFMWGGANGLDVQVSKKPVPILKEINQVTASGVIQYEVVATNEDRTKDRYYVSEFYRMRFDENRVKLLNFERKVEKVFEPSANFLMDQSIYIGISDQDVQYKANEDGTVVAFVQNGQLWCYSNSGQKITKVFGFEEQENSDIRYTNHQHKIKILYVDDVGSIDFLVYGYMNRGEHEGHVGVGVYHLSSENNDIEEKAFITTHQNFERLELDMGQLSYVTGQINEEEKEISNESSSEGETETETETSEETKEVEDEGKLYLMVANCLYEIDLNTLEILTVTEPLKTGTYASSDSGGFVAWSKENSPLNTKVIHMMNLETGEINEITSPEDSYIKPLGFMNDDLVYGFAKMEDVGTEESDSTAFPMYKIAIIDSDGRMIKETSADGYYITQVDFTSGLMTLHRVEWVDGVYQEAPEDHIINNSDKEKAKVEIGTIVTEEKQTQVVLNLPDKVKNKTPKVFHAKMLALATDHQLQLPLSEETGEKYYIYSYGKLSGTTTQVLDAIQMADEETGVVVNQSLQYVWERGNRKTKTEMDPQYIPDIIKEGTMDLSILRDQIDGTVLDLTGCTLEQILYFVSKNTPVLVNTSEGVYVIVGYDEFNTRVYNPRTQETIYKGMGDSTALFEASGNQFITYLETLKK